MVQNRVSEIQGRAEACVVVTIEKLIEEAEEVRVAALADKKYSAAITAIKEKGVLSGLRVERNESTQRTLADMSDGELEAIIRGGSVGEALN